MEAFYYTPAMAFEAPTPVRSALAVDYVSLAEIMASPDAWAVVLRHAPIMKMVVSGPQIQPFLTNMMVESFITYGGIITPEQIDAIDADFRQLPHSAWPRL